MFSNMKWVAAALVVAVLIGSGVAFAVETPIAPADDHGHDHHPTLEDAKSKVPFNVLVPSKLPENYQLTSYTLIESPTKGGKVTESNPMTTTGIALYYEDTSQEGGLTRDAIFFEQFLGKKHPNYEVMKGTKVGERTILERGADLWSVRHPKGIQTALLWENTDAGIFYNMVTYLSQQETLKVARSLE